MFHNYVCESADDLWRELSEDFIKGGHIDYQKSRNGPTEEMLHVSICIQNPRQRWMVSRQPSINPAFALAEVVWIMSGSNESKILNHWNPGLPNYAGYGDTYHGAYGYRLRQNFKIDQLNRALKALINNPDSRQVVLQIWDPEKDFPDEKGKEVSEDIPCNVMSILKSRNGKLEWLQIIRSNDIFLGLPHNIIQFTSLQEIIAGWLGVEIGEYHQVSDSLHIYINNKNNLFKTTEQKVENNIDSIARNKTTSDGLFSELFQKMEIMVNNNLIEKDYISISKLSYKDTAYQNILLMLAADSARRNNYKELANQLAHQCSNPVFKQLWDNWWLRKEGYIENIVK